jgi:hypothetical protein
MNSDIILKDWSYVINELICIQNLNQSKFKINKIKQSLLDLKLNITFENSDLLISITYLSEDEYELKIPTLKIVIQSDIVNLTSELCFKILKCSTTPTMSVHHTTIDIIIKVLEKELDLKTFTHHTYHSPGCYRLVFSDQTMYIGQSIDLGRRLMQHLYATYGSDIVKIFIYPIPDATTSELDMIEKDLIDHYDTYQNGRNNTRGNW